MLPRGAGAAVSNLCAEKESEPGKSKECLESTGAGEPSSRGLLPLPSFKPSARNLPNSPSFHAALPSYLSSSRVPGSRRPESRGQRSETGRRAIQSDTGLGQSKSVDGAQNTKSFNQTGRECVSQKKGPSRSKLSASAPEFVPTPMSNMGQPVQNAEGPQAQAGKVVPPSDSSGGGSGSYRRGSKAGGGNRSRAWGSGKSNRAQEPSVEVKVTGVSVDKKAEKANDMQLKEVGSVGEAVNVLESPEGGSGDSGGASASNSGHLKESAPELPNMAELSLSKEEKETNEQEQQDEVMVLESIFAGDFQQTSADPRSFELSVHVTLPSASVQVSGRLPDADSDRSTQSGPAGDQESAVSSGNSEAESGLESRTQLNGEAESGEAAETPSSEGDESPSGQIRVVNSPGGGRLLSLTLEHLPPLRLTCTLPASYPSHRPPKFALSSVWLSRPQLAALCQGLDRVWEENPGQVVVYSWADWLSRETFETLGLGERFEIGRTRGGKGKGKEIEGEDERAKAEGWGVQNVLPRLLRYNEEKTMEEFRNGVHECQICLSEQPGTEFVHLWPGCRHNFCGGCMKALADIHVKEGSLAGLACPQTDCKQPLQPNVIKDLLDAEQFQRWESLMLQKTFDSMSDVVYCPRCETATIEDSDHTAQCQACFFAFCSLCNEATHFGSECVGAEAKLAILRERTRGRLPAEEQKRKEAALLNEILNMKYVEREAKKCPKCGMAIQKDEGCNKMTCWNCSAYFCYKCGKAIDGYDHFNSGACVLFEADAIEAWNRMMNGVHVERNAAQDRIEALVEMHPNRVRNCPACRQPNIKEAGNNHLRCWSCQNHFCGACGRHVLKGSHHFGPKGCKQHTPD